MRPPPGQILDSIAATAHGASCECATRRTLHDEHSPSLCRQRCLRVRATCSRLQPRGRAMALLIHPHLVLPTQFSAPLVRSLAADRAAPHRLELRRCARALLRHTLRLGALYRLQPLRRRRPPLALDALLVGHLPRFHAALRSLQPRRCLESLLRTPRLLPCMCCALVLRGRRGQTSAHARARIMCRCMIRSSARSDRQGFCGGGRGLTGRRLAGGTGDTQVKSTLV